MKYIKYLLLTILLLPISVFAFELKCDEGEKPYQYGDSFSCYLKGSEGTQYDDLSGELEKKTDSVLDCSVEKVDNGLSLKEGGTNEGAAFSYNGTLNQETIVKYSCKVAVKPTTSKIEQLVIPELTYDITNDNKNASTEVVRSSSIKIQEYIEVPTGDTKPRDTSNANSRAKSISDSNGQLDFTFSAFKTIYNIEVKFEVSSLDLVVIPNNENSRVEIKGNQQLEVGDNVIDVYIISPDEVNKTCYTLNIKRLKRGEDIYYPEKNSELSDLKIEGYTINFESVIYEYKIHLPYDKDEVKVLATAREDGSVIEISKTTELYNGSKIDVVVTSQDGSSSTTYTINITKDAPPKDYRNLIYGGAIVIAIVGVIIIIIITNTRNKNNPLLRSKKKKEETKVEPVQTTESVDKQQAEQPVETFVPTPVVSPTVEVPQEPQPVSTPQVEVQGQNQPVSMPQVEQNNTNINQ